MSQTEFPRYYQLPVFDSCTQACTYCHRLGCLAAKTREGSDIERALKKAKSGEYHGVLLPCNFLFDENFNGVLEQIQNFGLQSVVQVNTSYFHKDWQDTLPELNKYSAMIHVVIDRVDDETLESLNWLLESYESDLLHFSVVGRDGFSLEKNIPLLPQEVVAKLHLYYPYHLENGDGFLTTSEIHSECLRLQKTIPGFRLRPPLGVDIYDPRVSEDFDLEPQIEPMLVSRSPQSAVKISVVIPTYNHKANLICTLRHLFRQDLESDSYEVIVVDDGSDDGTDKAVAQFFQGIQGQRNFKYIFYPRPRARQMGDAQFRAGVARNLGVKQVEGEVVAFLDSDILVPPNYLRQLYDEHKVYDVIQSQRLYLKKSVSSELTEFEDIDPETGTFVPEGGYWHGFYKEANASSWQQLPFHWKYTCTYGLSMKTARFKYVGWFKKNYIFYGFEDTDLGYRLYQAGASFHLSPLVVYHLFHLNERSEYQNSDYLRHRLLQKTARIFYHTNLQPEIYEHFRSLVSEKPTLGGLFKKARSLFDRQPEA